MCPVWTMVAVNEEERATRAKFSLHVSTVTPPVPSLNRTTTFTSYLPSILPFRHGWRRWVRHLERGQASCRTLSATILLVHPLWRNETLLVLRHVSTLCFLPSYLLPSFPSLARDQLSKVSQICLDLSRTFLPNIPSYHRATRRRHGIPDTDNRPFNVAYAAAVTARKENEARKNLQLRQRTLEEASPAPSPTRKSFGLDARQPLTSGKRVFWHATWYHLTSSCLVPGGLGSYPIRSPSVAGRARSSLGPTYGQQYVSPLPRLLEIVLTVIKESTVSNQHLNWSSR